MSTALEDLEAAFDAATEVWSTAAWKAYDDYKAAFDKAWYDYKERVAIEAIPETKGEANVGQGDGPEAGQGAEGDSDPIREDSGEASGGSASDSDDSEEDRADPAPSA